jgi:two-component SAPR family response regulator
MYRDACRFDKAKEFFEEALKILRRYEDRELEEDLLTRIALLHFTTSNFKEADKLFMEILSRFGDLLYGLNLIYKYSTVVAINIDVGDYAKAWDYLNRAEEELQRYNDPWITKYLVYMRGKLHWAEGRYRKAIDFLQEAVEKYETFSRILDPYIIGDIVDSHLRLGETSKAREVFSTMESVLDIINETPNLLVSYLTIRGSLETAEGRMSEALASLKEALRKALSIDKYYISMTTYYELSNCYFRQGAYEQALKCFKKCLEIARAKEYEAFLLIGARDRIDLFRLALENDLMVDYIMRILERSDTEQARNIINWMQIKRGVFDLQCRLLGKLEIRDARGRLLRPMWRTRNTKELFVLFITNHRKKYSKDQLIDMFWPRKDIRGAAHSLHVEISALRNTLKELLRSDLDTQKIVFFENGQYSLNPKVYVSTDIQEFEQLVNQAAAAIPQDRCRAKHAYLQALRLYQGDFCSDIYAQWCEEIRAYYKKLALNVLRRLGLICYDEKSYSESIKFLNQALEIDDSDEAVHVAIMRSLKALNDKDGVQRQYKKLVKTLNGMGISVPSREATELYQESLR